MKIEIEDCRFIKNKAVSGGAIYYTDNERFIEERS